MHDKGIHIAIIGLPASGKTAIAQLIKQTLAANGFKSVFHITDEEDKLPEPLKIKRLEAVAEKCENVKIIEVTARPKPIIGDRVGKDGIVIDGNLMGL